MSLFFNNTPSCRAEWSVKKASSDDDSLALVGNTIWQSLNPDPSSEVATLSIFPNAGVKESKLVCYAKLEGELHDFSLAIPQIWTTSYPDIFSSTEVFVSSTHLMMLSSIVLVAASEEAYSAATQTPTIFTQLLEEDRVLRQGEAIELVAPNLPISHPLSYTLWSLEPVCQGFAQAGRTEVIVLSSVHPITSPRQDVDREHDLIEINEEFLASSVVVPSPDHFDDRKMRSSNTVCVGRTEAPASLFTAKVLDTPEDLLEDHLSLYVRTSDLGRIGILNGDWAVAYARPAQSRLVSIIAKDGPINSPSLVAGSPILLHNIFGRDLFCGSPSLYISPSPFGSSQPAIPVARTVTIARVASPFSIHKRYQFAFVKALKKYFESGRRLMKQSDVFGVPIDTDDSRRLLDPNSEQSYNEKDSLGLSQLACPYRCNEVVFFKVTNIEYDLMPQPESFHPDFYRSSTLGELGCWVDSSITRIVQAGLEHSEVPDTRSYLQLGPPFSISQHNSSSSFKLRGAFSKLFSLTSAALSQRAVDYNISFSFLLKGERGVGKFTAVSEVARQLGFHLSEIDCYESLDESNLNTEATLRIHFDQAVNATPCILVLRHLEAFSRTTQSQNMSENSSIVTVFKEELAKSESNWRMACHPLVVVGTTSESERVPSGILNCLKHVIEFDAPSEEDRLEILKCLLAEYKLASDVSLQHVASQTAALVAADLRDLVFRVQVACMVRIRSHELDAYPSVALTAADFNVALGKARESFSESIGAPKIPAVSWDDVGGLAHVKTDILDMIQLPLEHPELFADGLKKRSGILLYGPPGTGKTLIAKAVATSFSLNFFSVKGPELLNMYIGESEANVRKVFQRARDAKPCIIFFDELDSVAPKRGNFGDSGGVMDRIVSQLLAELDGISSGKDGSALFVIGATNRPDLLEPALLRPGRFDRMLYLGVCGTHDAQLKILEALTRNFRLDRGLDLRSIAEKCPFNYTGADFYALCSDAMLSAMSRKAEAVEQKIAILNARAPPHRHPHPITPQYYLAELASAEDIEVFVTAEDFDQALRSLVPSVSQAEMEHYAQIQKRFSEYTGPPI